ncbi:MAG: endonuclease/exonuclease/phosphatase family protein [Bacteroidetes bacterium]|nr:endonuclease/exonuclease/phosphatase family protein [Bacteroidota bacterium]
MKSISVKLQRCLILISMLSCFSARAESPAIRVMTYNIRYENQWDTGSISWANRKDFITSSILFHKAGIIGMQEVLHSQLLYFESSLKDFSHVGAGREDGKEKGEYAPVFFNHTIFEKLQDSLFWLSSTPSVVSKGWDAALERICTWVKLKDKRSGKIFFVFNTHFDHLGEKAREESAKLILEQIRRIAGDAPVILTGDFNTAEQTIPIDIITGKESKGEFKLHDAMHASKLPHHGSYKTFCGFNLAKGVIGDRIDYIFVTRNFTVLSHATLTDFSGDHFPSDHFPVISELRCD